MDTNTAKVGVIGVGNVLMGDDAAGPYAIKMLKARCVFPEQVELVDGGTAGLALPGLMDGYDAVIVMDTVHAEAAPGTLCRHDRAALLAAPRTQPVTPHDPGLLDALFLSDLSGKGPREVILIGVVPDRADTGVGLSPAVCNAMGALVDAVVSEIVRLGVSVQWRETPLDPDLWWERSP